jgi:uncharacterized protein YidB (DUF937 family)
MAISHAVGASSRLATVMLTRDGPMGLGQVRTPAQEADMGLLDILNGMQTGGAATTGQGANPGASQGMSPIAKALLGLLAIYAAKNVSRSGSGQPTGGPGGGDLGGGGLGGGGLGDILGSVLGGGASGRGGPTGGGGGMGDILGGMLGGAPGGGAPGRGMPPGGGGAGGLGDILGGLLGGAGAGSALNGGLGDLLRQFEQSGQGDASRSWVGTGPNKAISPQDLESALGGDTLDTLSQHIGMGRGALANELSQQLPRFVDQLTPNGRLPTGEEAARMI